MCNIEPLQIFFIIIIFGDNYWNSSQVFTVIYIFKTLNDLRLLIQVWKVMFD